MDEPAGPARRDGGTHQVGKTNHTPPGHHAGGKHHAGPKPAPGKHAAPPPEAATAPGVSPRKTGMAAVSRRNLLISGGVLAAAVARLEGLRKLAVAPVRLAVDPANADIAGMHGRMNLPRMDAGLKCTDTRVMFVQQGLPRRVADQNKLVFAPFINPNSPMWMGFADQQVNASAPAPDVTFVGADGIHLTTAQAGEYFDNGALQHLSHGILDMVQFHDLNAAGVPGDDGTFLEHVQYMFRADPPPSMGRANQFLNGGGPSFLPNQFEGTGDARRSASGVETLPVQAGSTVTQHRIGHLSCLQRSSRTAGGKPIHLRMDGPGFDSLDVPDGTKQPKLEFTVFVPTADFFRVMRVHQASLDLQAEFDVDPDDNGLERFITATRRQNFLIPPRRHRAFPFAEFERAPTRPLPPRTARPRRAARPRASPRPAARAAVGPAAAVPVAAAVVTAAVVAMATAAAEPTAMPLTDRPGHAGGTRPATAGGSRLGHVPRRQRRVAG
jgi:hypothetical protein